MKPTMKTKTDKEAACEFRPKQPEGLLKEAGYEPSGEGSVMSPSTEAMLASAKDGSHEAVEGVWRILNEADQ
jgi:hypothetical protein